MDKKVRAALIGCGSISQRGILPHLELEDARQAIELVAVCDIVADRARETARQFGVPAWFQAIEDVLALPDVDALLIATPIQFHFQNAMDTIAAGKHIYLQKTMTTTLSEADAVIEAACDKGVKLVASPGQMLSPGYQRLRKAIGEQIVGRPYWAIASTAFVGHEYESYRADHPIDPTWYYKPGGGPVYDMSVYTLHNLTGLLGPAKQVTAMSGIGQRERSWPGGGTTVEMDDNTLLLLDFDGCYAMVGGHFCQTGKVIGWGFMGVYGSSGSLEITDLTPGTGYPETVEFVNARAAAGFVAGSYTATDLESLPSLIDDRHAVLDEAHIWADIHHFAQCIQYDLEPVPSGEHARHVIEIIEKGYEAARSGRTQALHTSFDLIEMGK